jgi:hypothetical protein
MASKRGFFLPSRRSLQRAARLSDIVAGNAEVRIPGRVGTIVERGLLLATINPNPEASLKRSIQGQVKRSLRVRGTRRIDETTSAAVGLLAIALPLARSADYGTARAVAQESALLVADHVAAAREGRREALRRQIKNRKKSIAAPKQVQDALSSVSESVGKMDQELAPVIPALRAMIAGTMSSLSETSADRFDIPQTVLETLLTASGRAEGAAAMVIDGLPSDPNTAGESAITIGHVLTMAATRAMELEDTPTVGMARLRLRRLCGGPMHQEMVLVASDLTSICCWIFPALALDQLDWYVQLVGGESTAVQTAGFARVGASALLAGLPSVACRLVIWLHDKGVDIGTLRSSILDNASLRREQTRSMFHGGYLGESPAEALANFVELANVVYAAV